MDDTNPHSFIDCKNGMHRFYSLGGLRPLKIQRQINFLSNELNKRTYVFVTTDGFTLIGRVVQLLTNALKTTISNSLLTKALQELVLCFMALAGIPRPPVMLICKRKSYRGIHRIFIRPFFAHITIQPMGNPRMKLGFWITNLVF